jgi:hypothetical protein
MLRAICAGPWGRATSGAGAVSIARCRDEIRTDTGQEGGHDLRLTDHW